MKKTIKPILRKNPDVRLRFYDVEAFSARVSDVIVWETTDLLRYQSLVEHLRKTPFRDHYFAAHDILPGLENAYADHYDVAPIAA